MSTHVPEGEPTENLPYIKHELTDEQNRRVWLINANTQAAELTEPEALWDSILNSRIRVGQLNSLAQYFTGENFYPESVAEDTPVPAIDQELARFFGREDAPDKLIVVIPTRDTRATTAVTAMEQAIRDGNFALEGGGFSNDVILPALGERHDSPWRTLISIGSNDWASGTPLHDGTEHGGFSMFTATATKVPRDFLNDSIYGPSSGRLPDDYWQYIAPESFDEGVSAVELQAALEAEVETHKKDGLSPEEIEAKTRIASSVLNGRRTHEFNRAISDLDDDQALRLERLSSGLAESGVMKHWLPVYMASGLPELEGRRPLDIVVGVSEDPERDLVDYLAHLKTSCEVS